MHSHASHAPKDNVRRLRWALVLTGTFMLVEVAGGYISGSLALLADAGHMLTDTAALALALLAFRVGARPADSKRTFGYQRLQILAAFVNALTLIVIVGWIVFEAVQRLMDPGEILAGTMLTVAIGGLIVNLIAFWILHGGDRENLNIQGAAIHVLGDLLGSVAAIVAAGVIMVWNWTPIDPILSLFVAALVLRSAWILLKKSGHILLEGSPEAVDEAKLVSRVTQSIADVISVHHLHVWSLSGEQRMLTMHAELTDTANQPQVLRSIKELLRAEFGVTHSTIEIDVGECADDTGKHAHT